MQKAEFFQVITELVETKQLDLVMLLSDLQGDSIHREDYRRMVIWILNRINLTVSQCEKLGVFDSMNSSDKHMIDAIPAKKLTKEMALNFALCGERQKPASLSIWTKALKAKPQIANQLWRFLIEVHIPTETAAKVDSVKRHEAERNIPTTESELRYFTKSYYISEDTNELLAAVLATKRIHWKRVFNLAERSQYCFGNRGYDWQTKAVSSIWIWLLSASEALYPTSLEERYKAFNLACKICGHVVIGYQYQVPYSRHFANAFCDYLYATNQVSGDFMKWLFDENDKNYQYSLHQERREYVRANWSRELFHVILEDRDLTVLPNETLIWLASVTAKNYRVFEVVRDRYESGLCSAEEAANYLLTTLYEQRDGSAPQWLLKFVEQVSQNEDLPTPLLIGLGARFKNIGDHTTRVLLDKVGGLASDVLGPVPTTLSPTA